MKVEETVSQWIEISPSSRILEGDPKRNGRRFSREYVESEEEEYFYFSPVVVVVAPFPSIV